MSTTTRPKRRRSQKERSAESARRIVDAAIALGAEKGFDRTSINEICRQAGYSKAMVHERYGSKSGLLAAILETEFGGWVTPLKSGETSGLDLALDHVDAYQQAARERPQVLRAFCVLSYETTGPIPELADWFRAALARYRKSVQSALELGRADGSVRPDLDTRRAAHQFTTYILGCGLQWSLEPEYMNLKKELPTYRREPESVWRATDR